MNVIKDDSPYDADQIAEAISALKKIPKKDMDLIAKLVAAQKKRKLLLIGKTILILAVILATYLILRYDVYQRIFTPKTYWANKVQSLQYSVKVTEDVINKHHNDQSTWQRTYDDEFDKMVKGLQKTGLDRDSSINKTKEIMQSVAKGMQEFIDNEQSIMAQFKTDLEMAKHELKESEKK